MAVEPLAVNRPELRKSHVVKAQALVGPEDGNGRIKLVERGGMGLDMAVKLLLDFFHRRDIDGKSRRAFRQGDLMDVEGPHGTGKYRMGAAQQAHLGIGLCRVDTVGCSDLDQ